MRRAALAILSTVAALVLLLSFKTHSATSLAPPPAVVSNSGTSSGTSTTQQQSSGSSRTATGAAVDTRYGPVQVRITVSGAKITNVTVVEYPKENPRDAEINAYAIPQLNQEALAASSTDIDMVSGATYTSEGYIASLQSALDKVKS